MERKLLKYGLNKQKKKNKEGALIKKMKRSLDEGQT